MILTATIQDTVYRIDLTNPRDISIPLRFDGDQPNTYGVPKASARPYEDGVFTGDTRRGGICNFETYTLTPHCNGTHTEGVGHIALERIAVAPTFRDLLIPATLISVSPMSGKDCLEHYQPAVDAKDRVITAHDLFQKLQTKPREFLEALVVRTLPNVTAKRSQNYAETGHAYFSNEAMDYLFELGVEHLLIDLPSVDRMRDEGRLSNHHLFWGVPQGSHDVDPKTSSRKTITEFLYIPDEIADGNYLVNIQIPDFVSDAAPSRVFLYELLL